MATSSALQEKALVVAFTARSPMSRYSSFWSGTCPSCWPSRPAARASPSCRRNHNITPSSHRGPLYRRRDARPAAGAPAAPRARGAPSTSTSAAPGSRGRRARAVKRPSPRDHQLHGGARPAAGRRGLGHDEQSASPASSRPAGRRDTGACPRGELQQLLVGHEAARAARGPSGSRGRPSPRCRSPGPGARRPRGGPAPGAARRRDARRSRGTRRRRRWPRRDAASSVRSAVPWTTRCSAGAVGLGQPRASLRARPRPSPRRPARTTESAGRWSDRSGAAHGDPGRMGEAVAALHAHRKIVARRASGGRPRGAPPPPPPPAGCAVLPAEGGRPGPSPRRRRPPSPRAASSSQSYRLGYGGRPSGARSRKSGARCRRRARRGR